jgi:hypothetical protein
MDFTRSKIVRRWYFLTLTLIFVILVGLRFTVLRENSADSTIAQTSASVTDELIAATITSLIVGMAYVFLYPQTSVETIEIVPSMDIAQTLASEARIAREWSVRSRGANYFTTVTLHNIIESALDSGRTVRVKILAIDPESPSLVSAYSDSMSDIRPRVGTWTPERARREIYASILRAAIQVQQAPRVEVEFGLSPSTWVMSLDLTEQMAIVTCQNKGEDALVFRRESKFFKSYQDDFDANWRVARIIKPRLEIVIPSSSKRLRSEHFGAINDLFFSTGLTKFSDDEILLIVKTLSRENDYA